MSRIKDLANHMEQIGTEIEVALRSEDSLEKYERLAELHRGEANVWKQYFESTREPMAWRAACAAADRSRRLAQFWDDQATREVIVLQNHRALVPAEQTARVA